jgi:NAD(P)-dependent dehydrogenase (short-subunit alcohol dehydrogenase family)
MGGISFTGRVAIVTGAGGGIGRTHALEIARRGGSVVVDDLGGDVAGRDGRPDMAEAVAGEIRAAGGQAIACHHSVADPEGAARIVEAAIDAFGRVDVLVNNAGNMRNAPLVDLSDEDWQALIGTHLTGSFNMTRAVWPYMAAQNYGRIVYTASSSGMFGMVLQAGYASAKAGVFGLMNVAAVEGEAHGILANAIMPNALGRMADQAARDWGMDVDAINAQTVQTVGNSMDPAFNAPLAVYLASEANTATHGLFSQCLGRIARVFVGVTPGWQAQRQTPPSVEEVAENWAKICDGSDGYSLPTSPTDEHQLVMTQPSR